MVLFVVLYFSIMLIKGMIFFLDMSEYEKPQ